MPARLQTVTQKSFAAVQWVIIQMTFLTVVIFSLISFQSLLIFLQIRETAMSLWFT